MRKFITYRVQNSKEFVLKLLSWSAQFEYVCFYNSNRASGNADEYEMIAAVGAADKIVSTIQTLESLKRFHYLKQDWLFGFLSYDLKNEIENLDSENFDGLKFPNALFLQPQFIFELQSGKVRMGYLDQLNSESDMENIFYSILKFNTLKTQIPVSVKVNPRISKQNYIESANKIKNHIRKGDIYEVNFCQEFFAEQVTINPLDVYLKLNEISESPFSAYCRFNDKYLISSSPERYLRKKGMGIISQPIKGTKRRGNNAMEDKRLIKELFADKKERSENVMIVDLVRNDLSRVAKQGTVKVDKLFEVYTFKQVHQMISTLSCEINDNKIFTDVFEATFPMGSMTGAPKVRAMQLIEKYESTKRGLYSGTIGYITPEGDFDFSVVIRSIIYNASCNYLSFIVGSAITDKSDSEKEYEECLLKAEAMLRVLNNV